MKAISSKKYRVIGYRNHSEGDIPRGWILQSVNSESRPNFIPETLIISEMKFIGADGVYYYKEDGSVLPQVPVVAYEYEVM